MKMKTTKYVFAIVVFAACHVYGGSSGEARLGGIYMSPSSDLWDSGAGLSAQWRSTMKDNWQFAASLGFAKIDANTDEIPGSKGAVVTGGQSGTYWGFVDKYEGDATIIPLGVSAIYSINLGQADVTLEGGLKYVFVNSSVKANLIDGYIDPRTGRVIPGSPVDRWKEDVDIGNNLLGTLGAQLNIPVSDKAKLYLGAGYQFDITKSDAKIESRWREYDGKSVTKSEFGGLFAEIGISFEL
jgi:hypothetical protein